MSLTKFVYQGVDASGALRSGELLATDARDAFRRVSSAGLTPLALTPRGAARGLFSWDRITPAEVVAFTRELAVLMEAKIPLDRGLASIAEHEGKPTFTAMVRDIAARIESGERLTTALERHKEVFGDVYVETLRAGEVSGQLSRVMTHLADLLEKQQETRQALRRAMAYPAIVSVVVSVAVTVIVVFVVPKFAATFATQGVQMPLATRVIQGLGINVRDHWAWYLGAVGAAVIGARVAWACEPGRRAIEEGLRRVPYVRRIIVAVTAARFARVLGIALSSGLDLIESVRIGGRSTGRPAFALECDGMEERLRGGAAFVEAVKGSTYLPPFARRMLGAGKDSAELAEACDIVARHYDREASHLMKNISTVIEPLLTVVMAAIVLVVALAVFLPMWKMASLHP